MSFANVSGRFGHESSHRRYALMRGSQRDERRARRYLAMLPVVIRSHNSAQQHVGLIRDLSGSGLFVYSDFEPAYGTVLELLVRVSRTQSKTARVRCLGKVVRVEKGTHGAAVGIALEIQEYELALKNKPRSMRLAS